MLLVPVLLRGGSSACFLRLSMWWTYRSPICVALVVTRCSMRGAPVLLLLAVQLHQLFLMVSAPLSLGCSCARGAAAEFTLDGGSPRAPRPVRVRLGWRRAAAPTRAGWASMPSKIGSGAARRPWSRRSPS